MKEIIVFITSFALLIFYWGLETNATEKPKESVVEKKAETKSDAKNASTKSAKKTSIADARCGKCHKGEKDVKKINEIKGIKNTEEMVKLIRQGPKAEVHKRISDRDLKAVGKELFDTKKPVETKKKEDIKTEKKTTDEIKKKEEVKPDAQKPQEKPVKKKPEGC